MKLERHGTLAAATTLSNKRKTHMSNKIPGLSDLANRLSDIPFPDEFSILGRAVEDRAANGDIHNCSPAGSHKVAVRFYLGGAQRTIGFTDNPCDAARFADMARVRFQQYRSRGSTDVLVDRDMNLDLHQVEVDTEEVPLAVALLDDIEHLLLQEGLIKTNATKMVECQEHFRNQVPRVQIRMTQKRELIETLKTLVDGQRAIYERLSMIEVQLNYMNPRREPPAEGVKPMTGYPNIHGFH